MRAFERAYLAQKKAGVWTKEFSAAKFGIADMVWIAWSGETGDFTALSLERELRKRDLFAFEGKLKDWRKALSQAYRYRYYADKAIVVMPQESSQSAEKHTEAFKMAKVGLWTFDRATGKIKKHYTPVGVKSLNKKARLEAIAWLSAQMDLSSLEESR